MNRVIMSVKIGSLLRHGVIARLCGSDELEDVHEYARLWREWLTEQPSHWRWPTWELCHAQFVGSMRNVCVGAGFCTEEGTRHGR